MPQATIVRKHSRKGFPAMLFDLRSAGNFEGMGNKPKRGLLNQRAHPCRKLRFRLKGFFCKAFRRSY